MADREQGRRSTDPAAERRLADGEALPFVGLAFIALCLVALALTPIFMSQRLVALYERSRRTTDVAAAGLDSLRLIASTQLLIHERARRGNDRTPPVTFADYWKARAEERAVLARLRVVAPAMGTEVVIRLADLQRALARWHVAFDARASGRMSEAEFVGAVTRGELRRDPVLTAYRRVRDAVFDAEARNRAAGRRAVESQRITSIVLGTLAAVAIALVALLARREHALARALRDAVREEARLRAESERRREDLVRVAESKSRLVRGFTHDVKNPIGAADGYLQLVEDGMTGPVTDKLAASVGKARRSIRSALALIGDLLEVARAEAGHLAIERVPTDVRSVALEVAEEFRAQAEAKGLSVCCEVAGDVPIVSTDPERVRQILGNLVSNAVKYTPAGSILVRVRARESKRLADSREWVLVEVSDTGPGIPEDKRRLIFHEFTRLDPAAAPGVGLGLAMARRITDALGGELTVRSEVGKGSTFVLALPQVQRSGNGNGRVHPPARQRPRAGGRPPRATL